MSSVYQRAIAGGRWADYTPTLGGFAIGNGTIASRTFRTGKLVFVEDHITFGSTSTFGSAPTLTLPSAVAAGYASLTWMDGLAQLSLGASMHLVKWRWDGSSMTAQPVTGNLYNYARVTNMSSTVPISWASGSVLTRYGFYEEA